MEDSHLAKDSVFSDEEVTAVREANDGFLPLDHLYRRHFLDGLQANRPEFYGQIKHLSIEEFVEKIMLERENIAPFELLKKEVAEAERSVDQERSVYWKEMLAILSFAMNYPTKYLSAEDMQRLQKMLMPLISIVIAFAPQAAVSDMLALHEAGVLDIVSVGKDSEVELQEGGGVIYWYTANDGTAAENYYPTFVDSIGQPHLLYDDVPYLSLLVNRTVSPGRLLFKNQLQAAKEKEGGAKKIVQGLDGNLYLQVPGITINDHFRVVDSYGTLNDRLYMMAVPFIGGYNPDYSGLDFG